MPVTIRRAMADDQSAIDVLVHSERLNPIGIAWPNFVVAIDEGALVGAVQIRKHKDGSRELASLVVHASRRGHGVAARLIEALLAGEAGPIFVITGRVRAAYFAQWGFRPMDRRHAPGPVKLNYYMGCSAGMFAVLQRRPINRLVILSREPAARVSEESAPAKSAALGQELLQLPDIAS